MVKIHIEATEAPHCTFSNRALRKLTVFFKMVFLFFNMAKFGQILTLFAQVMTSEANGANYGGYICYRP